MKTVKRFDLGRITSVEKTTQGYLKIPGYATRVGVFSYKKADGSVIREYRPAEEVFKKLSLDSLAHAPVTNEHPPRLLDPTNTKEFQVGYTTGEVKKDGNYVFVNSIVADASAISDVENGKRELSCGYECELDETPGHFDGEPYDVIQRNIIYNHLAIVRKGRAGPNVRFRLDAQDAEQFEPIEEKPMKEKISLGGVEFEVTAELATAIKSDSEKAISLQTEIESLKGKMDGLTSNLATAEEVKTKSEEEAKTAQIKCDTLQARVDHLETEIKTRLDATDGEGFQKKVLERVKLEKIAQAALPKDTKFDSLSNVELKKEVIKSQDKNVILDGKSEAYIDGRFDSVVAVIEKSVQATEHLSNTILNVRKDGAEKFDPEAARKKSMEDAKNAYKQPLSAVKNS